MANQILNVSALEEIEKRYKRLNFRIQGRLTDHYNFWLGLHLIAYGNDWQREDALERINNRIREGRSAFPRTPTIDDFVKSVRDKFSEQDRLHLHELKNLCDYANQQAGKGITCEEARMIYDTLLIMLYGSYYNRRPPV